MMAAIPAPMAGWSLPLPTVVDTISGRSRRRFRDASPAAHLGMLGGTIIFSGTDPTAGKRFVAAEHRGRRLGRPALRGRRVGVGLGLPGRRAQCADRDDRAAMPGRRRAARAAAGLRRRRHATAAASASTSRCATSCRASGICGRPAAAAARRGGCGAGTAASPPTTCCRRRPTPTSSRWTSPSTTCPHSRARSSAPPAAAAGASRSSATPSSCSRDVIEGLVSVAAGTARLRGRDRRRRGRRDGDREAARSGVSAEADWVVCAPRRRPLLPRVQSGLRGDRGADDRARPPRCAAPTAR